MFIVFMLFEVGPCFLAPPWLSSILSSQVVTKTQRRSGGGVGWFSCQRLPVPSWSCRRVCGGGRRFL